jgi:hypothetical protein
MKKFHNIAFVYCLLLVACTKEAPDKPGGPFDLEVVDYVTGKPLANTKVTSILYTDFDIMCLCFNSETSIHGYTDESGKLTRVAPIGKFALTKVGYWSQEEHHDPKPLINGNNMRFSMLRVDSLRIRLSTQRNINTEGRVYLNVQGILKDGTIRKDDSQLFPLTTKIIDQASMTVVIPAFGGIKNKVILEKVVSSASSEVLFSKTYDLVLGQVNEIFIAY